MIKTPHTYLIFMNAISRAANALALRIAFALALRIAFALALRIAFSFAIKLLVALIVFQSYQ
jgi:hypothetical protein